MNKNHKDRAIYVGTDLRRLCKNPASLHYGQTGYAHRVPLSTFPFGYLWIFYPDGDIDGFRARRSDLYFPKS